MGCGIWDFSRLELLLVLSELMDRLPHLSCWQQACPWSFREKECSFFLLLFMPTAEDTASTVLLCPGPSFCSPVCVLWDSPGDTGAHGCHQSRHQQPGHLCVELTWFGGGENGPNFSSQIWAKQKRENQQVQAQPELIFGGYQPWPTGGISRREPCRGERSLKSHGEGLGHGRTM